MDRKPALTGNVLANMFALEDQAKAITVAELEKRTAASKPQSRAKIAKADHADLVTVSHGQIVLAHIHPRWIRQEVERRLDAGEGLTTDDVEHIRARGRG